MRKKMLDHKNFGGVQYVFEHSDKQCDFLSPIQKQCMNLQRNRLILEAFMNHSGADVSDEEAMELANEAKHKTRQNS